MADLPPILLIPGLLCDKALWQFQTDYFAALTNVTVGNTMRDNSICEMAERILSEAPAKFALCGLSMGGYISMEIMRSAPDRVTHLILADTSAQQDSPEKRQTRLDLIALAQRGQFHGVTPRLLPHWLAPSSLENPLIKEIVIDMGRGIGKEIYLKQQTAIMGRIDSRPSLSLIKCPAAVIVGEYDTVTPVSMAKEIAELIPKSQLHIVPKAGHLTPLEAPSAFNEILDRLLNTRN